MEKSKETRTKLRRQRALDLRAFLARHSHEFSLKDVCKTANLNYDSTANAIGRLVSKNDPYAISEEKLNKLEEASISMAESNIEKVSA